MNCSQTLFLEHQPEWPEAASLFPGNFLPAEALYLQAEDLVHQHGPDYYGNHWNLDGNECIYSGWPIPAPHSLDPQHQGCSTNHRPEESTSLRVLSRKEGRIN